MISKYKHFTKLPAEGLTEIQLNTKINTMKIGSDFVISSDEEDEPIFPLYELEKDTYYAIELDV